MNVLGNKNSKSFVVDSKQIALITFAFYKPIPIWTFDRLINQIFKLVIN